MSYGEACCACGGLVSEVAGPRLERGTGAVSYGEACCACGGAGE